MLWVMVSVEQSNLLRSIRSKGTGNAGCLLNTTLLLDLPPLVVQW